MELERIETGVQFTRTFKGTADVIRFEAAQFAMERDRPHSLVTIFKNDRLLAFDYISLMRSEERIRLSNRAYGMLAGDTLLTGEYPKEFLQHELDMFCRECWPAWVASEKGVLMQGDAVRSKVPFVLDPFILKDAGTLLYGMPGAGKSWILMLMAVAVDAGIAWPWMTVKQQVLFTNIERSAASVARRLGMVNEVLGLPPNRPLLTINARGKSLRDIREQVHRTVQEFEVGLHCLDSISRAGFGDLTGDRAANAVIDMLNDANPTWLALAHAPRADATHIFGSVHFDAGADIVVRLASESRKDVLGIALSIDKANDTKGHQKQMLALVFDQDTGLSKLRMSTANEFSELDALISSKALPVTEELLIILGHLGEADATTLEAQFKMAGNPHDRTYLARIMSGSSLFESRKDGRNVLYRAASPAVQAAAIGAEPASVETEPELPF